MNFHSIKYQILIPIIIILIISSTLIILFLKNNNKKILDYESNNNLSKISNLIAYTIESEKNYLSIISKFISKNKIIIEAVKNRDTQTILNENIIKTLNAKEVKIHFHINPGISFLRVWNPNQSGDNLRVFRKSIVMLYNNKTQIVGIENGRKGTAIRALIPIFYKHKMIGSVEVFKTLSQILKDSNILKQFSYLILMKKNNNIKLLNNYENFSKDFLIFSSNSDKLKNLILSKKQIQDNNKFSLNNTSNIQIKQFNIRNINGETASIIFFGKKQNNFIRNSKNVFYIGILIIFITIISVILLFTGLITSKITKPIDIITKEVSNINLHGKIKKNLEIGKISKNEIGVLANKFKKLINSIAELFEFKETIEEDSSIFEVFERIKYLLKEKLKLNDFSIYHVKNSKDKIELIYNTKEEEGGMWCSREILIEPNHCRAKRTAKIVDSSIDYPGICPYFRGEEKEHICIPIYFQESVNSIVQILYNKSEKQKIESQKQIILTYLKEATPVLEAKQLMNSLKETIMRDPLTGIYNRRFLEEYADHLVKTIERNKEKLGIIMIDLDHFKKVNDRFGHDVGDYVLKNVVDTFHNTIRRSDMAFRYGGEEFLIILHDIKNKENAHNVAEKIRTNVEQSDVKKLAIKLSNITISLGVSIFPDDSENFWEAVKYADIALYRAKETGRNKVIIFDNSMKDKEEKSSANNKQKIK
jgi:diguanylate cyclase (GGDEF)-like protein